MIETTLIGFALAALICARRRDDHRVQWLGWVLLAAASVVAAITGCLALSGRDHSLRLPWGAPAPIALGADHLSGMMLLICFGIAAPLCLAAGASRRPGRQSLPALVAALLTALLLVLTATNLFTLLMGWEGLTVTFYLLTDLERHLPGRGPAATRAAAFGKISGSALLVGGLLLSTSSGSLDLASWSTAGPGASRDIAYLLLLAGFGAKVGLVPLQIWLPATYTAAPAPARALLAGVAVNAGFYGWLRTLQTLGSPPAWLATAVLLVGGLTAILGIAQAAVADNLARLIAWSSIENAGVIATGFGMGLVGAHTGQPRLTAAGLVAATAQIVAHSLGKSLLYCATMAIDDDAGTLDLDQLRGVGRKLPAAGLGVTIGALTLAGMPLTAGFASEWLTLQALMQQFRTGSLAFQLGAAFAGSLVALTIGVAGLTFVRVVGLTAYGDASRTHTTPHTDTSSIYRTAIGVLCFLCLAVSAAAHWEFAVIARGLSQLVGDNARAANAPGWVVQPVYSGFSALSPGKLWIELPLMCLAVLAIAAALSGRDLWQVRTTPVWSSGSPGVERQGGYTSFSFANPMRRVLATMLLSGDHTAPVEDPGRADSVTEGMVRPLHRHVTVVEIVERYGYAPIWRQLIRAVHLAQRLQSGRLDAYLAYMLLTVIAAISVVTFWY
ncbi:proton-conducting transporter membrane subunit [Flexivirga caeni]|uniref:NADH/ubiquinone/plastoquinone (Complex I) n=1 Tax=Flexivirga caeni TaxID=2294115 RepID=A0A3M9MH44_9MICO|nr:proton-conducting transporter membrane subunit [Flexivirga caeni]RNI24836.1 NADH/ubiquinone/plastoquinone (complex I) [Flexivirga caeni]